MSGRVVLGRYRVVAPLARGGMGIVYLGRLEGAAGFAKPVVIKTVIPDAKDDRSAQLFVREARILSNLEHPAIVGVLDFGEVDGEYVMVLEYVHGFHLGNWARYVQDARGQMPLEHAVEVMLPVLEALEFAHSLQRADGTALGIVHRDVSPANILLDHLGHVKLHDFGIARMADDEFKTQDGTFRGTLAFTAPETLQGMPASPRSDLYACGVVLYQLITGKNPYRGQQPSETLHRVLTHTPTPLAAQRREVTAALDAAVACALEKDPEKRFASAGSFAAALRAARTWSEAEATADLQHCIHADFTGSDMPRRLSLETLQSRDAAWRAAQPSGARSALSSSPPPARPPSREPPTVKGEVAAPDGTSSLTIQAAPSSGLLELARSDAPAVAVTANTGVVPEPRAPLAPAARHRGPWAAALVAVGVLALGGSAYALWRANEPAPPPRFLLIEKQAESEAPAPVASAAAAGAIASAAPVSAGSAAPVAEKNVRAPGATSNSGSSLTAAFQRQRGRVESCFRSHVSEAEQQAQLTIRFEVEASGVVRGADLQPAALGGSALGSCILGVARSTRFPAGDAPVTFSIPITARKSGR